MTRIFDGEVTTAKPIPFTSFILISGESLHLDREHGGQVANDWRPVVARIGRYIDLATGGAEVDAAGIESVHGHRVAQNVYDNNRFVVDLS